MRWKLAMSMQVEERIEHVENGIVLKDVKHEGKNEGKKNEDVLMNIF